MATSYEGQKSKGWCFTLNNPTEDEITRLVGDDYRYLIFQYETCPTTGTLHAQGMLYYKGPRVWPVRKWPRAHWSPVRSVEASIRYCSKEESRLDHPDAGPHIYGDRPQQGERSDLKEVAEKIRDGMTLEQINETEPEIVTRYGRGLGLVKTLAMKHRTTKPECIWIWGPGGAGKTKWVTRQYDSVYIKDGSQWWDGYNQEEVILIDDFDGKWPFRDFLRLLDDEPYQGQVKGGYVKINSPRIFITCEWHPKHFYETYGITGKTEDNQLIQVMRRLKRIIHKTGRRPEVVMPEEVEIE